MLRDARQREKTKLSRDADEWTRKCGEWKEVATACNALMDESRRAKQEELRVEEQRKLLELKMFCSQMALISKQRDAERVLLEADDDSVQDHVGFMGKMQ